MATAYDSHIAVTRLTSGKFRATYVVGNVDVIGNGSNAKKAKEDCVRRIRNETHPYRHLVAAVVALLFVLIAAAIAYVIVIHLPSNGPDDASVAVDNIWVKAKFIGTIGAFLGVFGALMIAILRSMQVLAIIFSTLLSMLLTATLTTANLQDHRLKIAASTQNRLNEVVLQKQSIIDVASSTIAAQAASSDKQVVALQQELSSTKGQLAELDKSANQQIGRLIRDNSDLIAMQKTLQSEKASAEVKVVDLSKKMMDMSGKTSVWIDPDNGSFHPSTQPDSNQKWIDVEVHKLPN